MRLLTMILFAASVTYSASPDAVAPWKYQAPAQEKLRRAMRSALPSLNQNLPRLRPHVLPPVDDGQVRNKVDRAVRQRVGIHRHLDASAMSMAQRDGSVWRLAIQSPGAGGLRIHFTQFDAGDGQVWIHDGSGDQEQVLGPYTARGPNGDGDFWSDIVLSDTVTVEYQPGPGQGARDGVPFAIQELSHQFATRAATTRNDAAASCELDVTCYNDWASTASGVTRLLFEDSEGSYACSGTLLSTRSRSGVPYVLTANHCIDTQALARTVEATWFYQKDRCNGALPSSFPRSLGATLVVTGDRTKGDFTLLKLNSVPNGVTFQGWDPSEKPVGTPVTVIHHPRRDYKRIAFGNVSRNANISQAFYSVFYSQGLTETGSSGSGVFSAPGVLVGTLSNGPTADTPEQYCSMVPFADNYGKFSSYYPMLRNALEDGNGGPAATTSPSTATALTSGVAQNFTLPAAASAPALFYGYYGFTVNVPQGATRLDITLRTTTPNVDVDLYARYGQDLALGSNGPIADYGSQRPDGNEQLTITASSNPPLRAGTYYIGFGLFTRNVDVSASITATVTAGGNTATPPPPPPTSGGGGNTLISGEARNVTLPPASDAVLYNRDKGFTIDVPQGATRLEVKLSSSTPRVDLDLYVRYGQDPVLTNNSITADYASQGDTANEAVTVTGASNPPLKAGTYYIAIGSFTPGVSINATITATVTTGSAPPPGPAGSNVLTSGQPRSFSISPVTAPTLFNGPASLTIVVPQGATSLDIALHTTTPKADVGLVVRYNRDVDVSNGQLAADYATADPGGEDHLTINASSAPPLRAGTYYISLAMVTPNIEVVGTITATVSTAAAPPPPPATGATVLTSGVRRTLFFEPVSEPTLLNGTKSYAIDVPANATRVDIQLTSSTAGADMDLYVSYGKDNTIGNGRILADFASEGPDGNERIIITPDSQPRLQPGRYYISIAIYTSKTNILGSLTATVTTGEQPTAPGNGTVLTLGEAAKFSLPPVTGATLFNGERSFQVRIPDGATQMRIQVTSDHPEVDVDVFARYQNDVGVDDQGYIVADYGSEGDTGNETITVTSASAPPLKPGVYYISLLLYSENVPSTGTIVVTADGSPVTSPGTAGTALTSGVPVTYSLPAVGSPTLFAGSTGYRITVGSQHTGLRISVKNDQPATDVDLFVRRGQEPAVVTGRLAADFASTNEGGVEEVLIQGSSLQPGVYYIALALYPGYPAATGTITATLYTAGGASTEVELMPISGLSVNPKRSEETRHALPDKKNPAWLEGKLEKHHSTLLKKRKRVQANRW